jgi:predicted pyridoxine 5'-phosphate oxidase superfamily flavin-nucleotide-binding protein
MIKITDDMKEFVNKALADGVPCLVGTVDPDGSPNIGPKGSVLVFDDATLAYWERSFRGANANVRKNDKVVVYYRNPAAAQRLGSNGALRFHGRAEVHERDAIREQVKPMVVKPEIEKDPENKGFAVLIRLDKITDLSGKVLQSR